MYFTALYRALASSRTRLLDHTQRRATVGRISVFNYRILNIFFALSMRPFKGQLRYVTNFGLSVIEERDNPCVDPLLCIVYIEGYFKLRFC